MAKTESSRASLVQEISALQTNTYAPLARKLGATKLALFHEILDIAAATDPEPLATELESYVEQKLGVKIDIRQIRTHFKAAHQRRQAKERACKTRR